MRRVRVRVQIAAARVVVVVAGVEVVVVDLNGQSRRDAAFVLFACAVAVAGIAAPVACAR